MTAIGRFAKLGADRLPRYFVGDAGLGQVEGEALAHEFFGEGPGLMFPAELAAGEREAIATLVASPDTPRGFALYLGPDCRAEVRRSGEVLRLAVKFRPLASNLREWRCAEPFRTAEAVAGALEACLVEVGRQLALKGLVPTEPLATPVTTPNTTFRPRGLPLNVDCPECGAEPGECCRDAERQHGHRDVDHSHAARERAFAEWANRPR